MATITFTNGAADGGKWSTAGNWDLGRAPLGGVGGDDAVIPKNLTAKLDTTGCVAKSVALNLGTTGADVGGILTCTTTANWDLTVYNGITCNGSNSGATYGAYSSNLNLDMSAAPSYTGTLALNGAAATSAPQLSIAGKVNVKGATRKRWTLTTDPMTGGATSSIHVADATGWRDADLIVFATTQAYNATPRVDVLTIATGGVSFDSGSSGPATVTFTASATYDHADNCLCGNLTSNLIIKPAVDYNTCVISVNTLLRNTAGLFDHVQLYRCKAQTGYPYAGVFSPATNTGVSSTGLVFYDCDTLAIGASQATGNFPMNDVQIWTTRTCNVFNVSSPNGSFGDITDLCLYRSAGTNALILPNASKQRIVRPKLSGITSVSAIYIPGTDGKSRIEGGGIWSSLGVTFANTAMCSTVTFDGVWLGKGFEGAEYANANNSYICRATSGDPNIAFLSCPENLTGGSRFELTVGSAYAETAFYNRNGDPAVQDVYLTSFSITTPIFTRETSTIKNAASSIKFATLGGTTNVFTREFSILVKGNEAATIILYVRKNAAYNDGAFALPSATLSGLGITPISDTGTDVDDTWELLDLSYGAGSAPSSDGILTLTLTAMSATATGAAYFSGIPIPPFVSRCRHYGYLFDETTPTRTVDSTISAAFGTADAYTGITISWGAISTISIGANQTFQKLVDYTAAKAIAHVSDALPITWAGVADNAALFAQGDITTTGYTLNGGGSLAMGSKTLTATGYTYTGGTFSQLTSTPAFSGGTVSIAAEGAYDYTLSSCGVEFGAAGTGWDLSGATISGTIAFTTSTGALAVTVAVPTGTSYTVEGANITVTAPIVSADISITGMANTVGANNRLQIINASALAASDWQAATAYVAGDVVLRTSGIGSENTAGLYMRCTSGGTSGGAEPTWATTVGNTTADNSVTWTTYAVLYYDADPAGTSLTDTYTDGEEFVAGETIEIRFAEEDPGVTFKTYSTSVVATADGFSALVNETADDVYATYALSGAAYDATFSPNYVANYIVLDTNTNFTGSGAYAYYCYLLTTSQGMYRFWGGLTGIDAGNIRNNVSVVSLYFDCSSGFVRQTDDVRIFRSDGLRPAIDPVSAAGGGIEINWKVPVNVVSIATASVLSPAESAQLMALPSATANAVRADLATELGRIDAAVSSRVAGVDFVISPTAEENAAAVFAQAGITPIPSNMKQTNDEQIIGDGSAANKFRSHLVP